MILLELKYGRKDLLEVLDEVRDRVLEGKIDMLAITEFTAEGHLHHLAWKSDAQYPWARFTAAAGALNHELTADGLQAQ